MRQYGRLFLSFSFFFALFVGIVFSSPIHILAQEYNPIDGEALALEIDEFAAAGASAYLVWQYSGTQVQPFGNDPYSFFRNTPDGDAICAVLKEKSSKIAVGVNMWDSPNAQYSPELVTENFTYLKNSCGVSIVRVFGYSGGGAGTRKVLDAASSAGIQIIVAIGDYSNQQGGVTNTDPVAWYSGGYRGAYLNLVNEIRQATQNHPALYGYELANEAHCGSTTAAIGPYNNWIKDVAPRLPGKVGVGQFANNVNSACDSPGGNFKVGNAIPAISMTSSHYYNAEEKAGALQAAAASKEIGKTFYIGEASFGGSTEEKNQAFVYPGIEDMQSTADKNAMAASYMLTCGNKITLQGDIRGDDKLNDALPNYNSFVDDGSGGKCDPNNPACSVEAFGNVFIDNTKTVIPLFRMQDASVPRPSDPKRRTEDLEGFFSSIYTKKQTAGAADQITPLANGVSRKLTPANTQCANTMTYLNAIKQLCDEEKNRANIAINAVGTTSDSKQPPQKASPSASTSGECALYLSIPGADSRYASYRDVQARVPSVSGEQICSPKWIDTVKTRDKEWYKAFSSIEVTTPKGFKPAYIVRYMDRPEEQPSSFTSKVTWLAPSKIETDPEQIKNMTINDRIQITRVYVPAGFAEENNASVKEKRSFFPTYDGGFTQMVKSILPRDIIERIETITQLEVKSLIPKVAQYSLHTNGDKKYVQCEKCNDIDPDDYRGIIVRRINAQFSTQIGLEETGTPRFEGCTEDDYVGETAKDIVQTVNPPGVSDPVQPRKQTAVARLTAGGTGGGEPQTVRTFLLLPEEYRNINNYELAFAQTFVSHVEQEKPDFQYIAQRSDRKDPKNAYRYLQLSQSGFDISSPGVKAGAPLGININQAPEPDPNAPIDPMATPTSDTYGAEVFIEGKITGAKAVSEYNPDPQVPGGILARGLWQVMCNVLRPHDGVKTIQYAGFEAFLKEGPAACTKGAKPGAPTTPGGGGTDGFCQGTTTIPTDLQDASLAKLKAYINSVETSKGIPRNLLWGIINIEGSDTLRTMRTGGTSLSCGPPDQFGSAGPLQLQSSQCGGFGTWEQNSSGVTGGNCDLKASIQVAGNLLVRLSNYPSVVSKSDRWYRAAGMYNGLCLSEEQFSAGAASCQTIDLRNSNQCSGAPTNIQGCNGLNYCGCAFGFN